MSISYKLEKFEGPLDLLLHLIDEQEIDIYDIPIAQITDQYLAYLEQMQQFDLEPASEFLVMAATLLAIKSSMLLPKPPPVELGLEGEEEIADPREELVQSLIEYRKYKMAADELRNLELERSLIFSREPADLSPFASHERINPLQGIVPADLLLAFGKVLRRVMNRNTVATIRKDEMTVKDRIRQLIARLRQAESKVMFSSLFADDASREEVIVTFLALLELMKNKWVTCYQHALFEDIVIQYRGVDLDEDEIWGTESDY